METITKTFGKIKVDSVNPHRFKEGVDSAELTQIVTRTYPGKKVGNSFSSSLYSASDFGFAGTSYEQTRKVWIEVPQGSTVEQVQAKIDSLPNARIYRILSLEPVLTDEQKYKIADGTTTIEQFANSQMVKNSAGEAVPYGDQPQYAANFFDVDGKEDIDLREVTSSEDVVLDASAEDLHHG